MVINLKLPRNHKAYPAIKPPLHNNKKRKSTHLVTPEFTKRELPQTIHHKEGIKKTVSLSASLDSMSSISAIGTEDEEEYLSEEKKEDSAELEFQEFKEFKLGGVSLIEAVTTRRLMEQQVQQLHEGNGHLAHPLLKELVNQKGLFFNTDETINISEDVVDCFRCEACEIKKKSQFDTYGGSLLAHYAFKLVKLFLFR